MIGHGQVEGFHEKYGMEYKRAYWDEPVDHGFVRHHETHIFPLMRRRHIFSGADQFVLYDFFTGGGQVDENVFAYSNRAGNDRGLIIYNNRYGDTSGWIRYSCATLRKDLAGKGSLVQRSLGEALDFNGDGRHYYSFKDYATGLSYLRSGRDLWEQGLYVEMSGYEYHAFLDFKEIRDDEFGTWGTLCYRLNGAGVESVEDEVKQVRWGAANEALKSLLAKVAAGTGEPGAEASSLLAPLEPLLATFYKALAPQAKEKELRAQLASFGNEMTLAIKYSPVTPAEHPQEWLLLCTFLALHRIGALSGTNSAEAVDYYGLLRPVEQSFAALPALEEEEALLSPREWGDLLMVLIRHESFLDDCRDKEAVEVCRLLFEDPLAGSLMYLHESDGVEWFNKERFELILDWFARLYPYVAAPQEEPEAAVCALLCETGAASGYRLDRFLALLESGRPV
jgi:hypothetical protein